MTLFMFVGLRTETVFLNFNIACICTNTQPTKPTDRPAFFYQVFFFNHPSTKKICHLREREREGGWRGESRRLCSELFVPNGRYVMYAAYISSVQYPVLVFKKAL